MKTLLQIFFCVIFFNAVFFKPAFSQHQNILTCLPVACEITGWDMEDSARLYAGEELFTLIDGGADIFFEYGFQQAAAAKYRNHFENSIKLEIYEMSDAPAAYGMFTLNAGTRGKIIQIGNEGRLFDYYLMFWKNTFLIFLTGGDTTDETKYAILEMAANIDKHLGVSGEKPALASYLPNDDLLSCTFIRGSIGLSSFYTFDTKNIFRIKEGIIGIYPTHQLYIFRYDSGSEAKERYLDAQSVFKSGNRFSNYKEHGTQSTMTDKKGAHLCITYLKNIIAVVLAQSKNNAMTICTDIVNSLRDR